MKGKPDPESVMSRAVDAARKAVVMTSLQVSEGDVTKAAAKAGICPSSMWRLMKRYRIRAMDYWPADRKIERIFENIMEMGDRTPRLF